MRIIIAEGGEILIAKNCSFVEQGGHETTANIRAFFPSMEITIAFNLSDSEMAATLSSLTLFLAGVKHGQKYRDIFDVTAYLKEIRQ